MLAVVGTALPMALRTFLLTLAVVDDLLAIGIIAFFYTDDLAPWYLVGSFAMLLIAKVFKKWSRCIAIILTLTSNCNRGTP